MKFYNRRAVAAGVALAFVVAACGDDETTTEESEPAAETSGTDAPTDGTEPVAETSGTDAPTDSAPSEPASGSAAERCGTEGPIELDYWTWGGGYNDAADLWSSENPDIQIRFSDIAVGNSGGYQKIRNAIIAGEAPDIVFLEFDTIPSFVVDGSVVDVAEFVPDEIQADFLDSMIEQVAVLGEGTIMSVPIGSGPVALYYRQDLFEENGIDVPATWAEFASAAEAVAATGLGVISNFEGVSNANWFAGMTAQNGSQWFQRSDAGWTVDIDDDPSIEVAEFWQDLIERDLVETMASFSPEWSAAFASGQFWTWPSAVWGTGVLKSAAPDTAGKWAVAPLPVWSDDLPAATSWGGGGLSVLASSEHPCEAAAFATWMGSDDGALEILNAAIGIFPTTSTLLASPLFSEPDPFFGDQKIFEIFIDAAIGQAPITWGPLMTDTYASITDAFGESLGDGNTSLADALGSADESTEATLGRQGFSVE